MLIDPDQPAPAHPASTPSTHPPTPTTTRATTLGRRLGPARGMTGGAGAALAVENLVSICRRLFAGFWGPRTDDLMRAACLTLPPNPTPRTLADLPTCSPTPTYRARATTHGHRIRCCAGSGPATTGCPNPPAPPSSPR